MDGVTKKITIEPSWKVALASEFEADYFKQLADFVRNEYQKSAVFPAPKNIFRAFDASPLDATSVVILGQDPYHGEGQANGLCFAVPENTDLPPSLKNIFKEIKSDLGIEPLPNGDLTRWAKQRVLLLNATLTVRAHAAGSHQNKGWEEFTDAVIRKLSQENRPIVFLLWGNYARKKGAHIDRAKHLVLESAHPSPLSAYNGFFGNKHFSQTNAYLKKHGRKEIDWR
jgi:uracil-DNA glycosylase